MSNDRVERRLAAVLAADVVDYSSLMGLDEVGTRARFNTALDELIRPAIANHQGRLVKTMGDGLLVEFASVVDAVDCAVKIQDQLSRREKDEADPMQLRIGVNLGDIIVQGDDIHGDGVNIAARLEALAPPGGICISRSARDQVRDKLAYRIDDLGEIEVKNIARPVRAFQINDGPAEATGGIARTAARASQQASQRRRWPVVSAAVVVLAVAVGVAVWFEPWAPRVEAASVDNMKFALPDKPSVAVLPFDVTSNGDGDREFADAVNEDLTRGLARVSGLFVIARSSTLGYVGEKASPAKVAEELGVQHVVRASLRRAGNRVRIDAELTDALSGRIIWSERFERSSDDLFDLQDDLVQALAIRMAHDLQTIDDQRRFTDDVEAYFMWFAADSESWRNNAVAYGKAKALAQGALERDPNFVRAKALLAFVDTQRAYFKQVDDPGPLLESAYQTAKATAEAAPGDWYTLATYGQTLMNKRDYLGAAEQFERAIALDPSNTLLLTRSTLPLIFLGRGQEAEARLRIAVRLNPYHNWLPDQLLGQSLFLLERYQEPIDNLLVAKEKNPRFIGNLWWRAAAYGQMGMQAEAEEVVAEILKRMPGAAISKSFIQIKDEQAMTRYTDGLRAAGLPE